MSFPLFSQTEENNGSRDSIVMLLKEYSRTKDGNLPQKAFLIAEQTKIDSVLKKTYFDFGLQSYFNKDTANIKLTERKLHKLFIQTKEPATLAKQYYYKSLFHKVQLRADSAFYYLHKSKNISIQLKDSLEATRRLLSMAAIQFFEKDFLGSEITIIEGLRLVEPLEEVFFTGLLYERLANVLFITERQEEARKNYLKFFELQKRIPKVKLKYEKVRLNLHLAKTYEAEQNYTKAIEYFRKCLLVDSVKVKSTYRYEGALEGFSFSNFMLGNKKLALKGYLEVLKSRQARGHKRGLIFSYSLLGAFYADDNKKKKAIFYAEKALKVAKEIRQSAKTSENLLFLSDLVKGEKGRQYLEARATLNDSLYKRERGLKNQFAKVRYETEKKEIENRLLKQENSRKKLELERQRQQKVIGWLLAGGSLLFIGFGVSIVFNRRKKMIFEAKLQQVAIREKERQQIAKSLHDEVAGDIRMLHLKLATNKHLEEAGKLEVIKENVRNLSHQLSSESFDSVTFKDQVINVVSDFFESNISIKIQEIDAVGWLKINNSIKRTLFLSIRESIQNTHKHAQATVLILEFRETKKAVFLTISDNGKGFDTAIKQKGIGLKNMQERIEEINGVFFIESALDQGTTIHIQIAKYGI
ncbi:MAG: ATP-binding protein [Polaribacter sp.]|uniref:tetratricopeptide repeat-containing sensor histidine kinase n=1 Tax=Polaribacter sp. TaxID=1920175 RepID=UPI00384D27B6